MERCRVAPEQQGLGRVGRCVDNDPLAADEQFRQLIAHFLAQLVVQISERFVEKNEIRILYNRSRDGCSLLLTARKLHRPTVKHRCKP
jgi:hypothetical protein